MGVEVVGDTKVRISVEDEFEDYEEILDEVEENDNELTENMEINENYLN